MADALPPTATASRSERNAIYAGTGCTYRSGVELCRLPLRGASGSGATCPFRMILSEDRGPDTAQESTTGLAEAAAPASWHFLPAFPGTSRHHPHHTSPSGSGNAPENRAPRTTPGNVDRGDSVLRTRKVLQIHGSVAAPALRSADNAATAASAVWSSENRSFVGYHPSSFESVSACPRSCWQRARYAVRCWLDQPPK